ncbi:hypothetical protein C6A77_01765 [Pseudomonas sp. AFG_SD02_1510_Pfu_092]|nr:hypothetical protein C6A77_01765 [Pseudomonas sp. AFG_SD02_1510_Pfu_092]
MPDSFALPVPASSRGNPLPQDCAITVGAGSPAKRPVQATQITGRLHSGSACHSCPPEWSTRARGPSSPALPGRQGCT